MKVLCFDAEFAIQEVLELSVWELPGWPSPEGQRQAFHQYFRPVRERVWKGSQRVHHISPEMVRNKPHFSEWRPRLQKLFDEADLLVGFAIDNDIEALTREGIKGLERKPTVDVRDLHWVVNTRKEGVELDARKGLAQTSLDLGVEFSDNLAHGADYDTRKTLECFRLLMEAYAANLTASTPEGDSTTTEAEGEKALSLSGDEILGRYLKEWEERRENFYREFAKGWVYIQKWRDSYRVKAVRLNEPKGEDVVAKIYVNARNRALDEIDEHFARRRHPLDSHGYDLRRADISWFEKYTNEYDGKEQLHRKMAELRQLSSRKPF